MYPRCGRVVQAPASEEGPGWEGCVSPGLKTNSSLPRLKKIQLELGKLLLESFNFVTLYEYNRASPLRDFNPAGQFSSMFPVPVDENWTDVFIGY